MLTSATVLPPRHRVSSDPLPPAVSRHPIQPATAIQLSFQPVAAPQQQRPGRIPKQSAKYRTDKLDKEDPNRKRVTKFSYACKHCGNPKTKEYGHRKPRSDLWYCPSFGDFMTWKRENNLWFRCHFLHNLYTYTSLQYIHYTVIIVQSLAMLWYCMNHWMLSPVFLGHVGDPRTLPEMTLLVTSAVHN